jgi:hypothetical protein
LTFIYAFDEWDHLLKRAQHKFMAYTNYKNLEHFMNACMLNPYEVQWSMSIGKLNIRRKSIYLLENEMLSPTL